MNVLYFQRDAAVAKALASEFRKVAMPQDKLRLFWFAKNFNYRSRKYPSLAYPLVVDLHGVPTVFDVKKKEFVQRSEERMWWQESFDAAIIDVSEDMTLSIGRRYAEWLALADFAGPVVLRTAKRHEVRSSLRSQAPLVLRGDDPAFAERALDFIRKGIERPEGHWHVNSRGRRPDELLSAFYALAGTPMQWHFVYFGDDDLLAQKMSEFLVAPFHDGQALHSFKTIKKALKAAAEKSTNGRRLSKPRAILVDCGDGDLTDAHVDMVHEATAGLNYVTFTVFAARTTELDGGIEQLKQMNAVIAPRDELLQWPAFWAGNAVDQLALSYGRFRDLAQAHGLRLTMEKNQDKEWKRVLEAAQEVLKHAIVPFMMARSRARLAGTNGLPSFVRWMRPSQAVQLNREFPRCLKLIVEKLHEAQRVSELQRRAFNRDV